MPYKDSSKQKDAQRHWYLKNRLRILEEQANNREAATAANRKTRNQKKARVCAIKESSACLDCGKNYPARVMEFDHVRGEKVGNISAMLNENAAWHLITDEIAKCDLVCANCHRLRH